MKRALLRTGFAYLIGVGLLWFVMRKVAATDLRGAFAGANMRSFLPVRIMELSAVFLGECYLFARVFSLFQRGASLRDMLLPNAARCFLQVLNSAFGEGFFVFAISRKLAASFVGTGFSLIFLALIDFHVMLLMALAGALLAPQFPLKLPFVWLLLPIAALWMFAFVWMSGPPRIRVLEWIYNRPALVTFRTARFSDYAQLTLIRGIIFLAQTVALFFEFRAFAIPVTMLQMVGAMPLILLANGTPLTPVGIGTSQAVIVFGFAGLAPRADLLALSLAYSGIGLGIRALLGIFLPEILTKLPEERTAAVPVAAG